MRSCSGCPKACPVSALAGRWYPPVLHPSGGLASVGKRTTPLACWPDCGSRLMDDRNGHRRLWWPSVRGAVQGGLRRCPARTSGRLRQCPVSGSAAEPRLGVQTALSTVDTAADCGCPLLQEAVARPASAGGVQPPPPRPADMAGEPAAELLAHIRHGRPLQRQHLLGGQRAKPQAVEIAAAAGADHRAGRPPGIDAELGPGVSRPARRAARPPSRPRTPAPAAPGRDGRSPARGRALARSRPAAATVPAGLTAPPRLAMKARPATGRWPRQRVMNPGGHRT
jgi:hypothetical protein